MKKIIIINLLLLTFRMSFGSDYKVLMLVDTIIKTPTNVSVSAEKEIYELSEENIAYWNQQYQILINNNPSWNATIIGDCSIKYNCHGYAWHTSDCEDTIIINTLTGHVNRYFDDSYGNPSYFLDNTNVEDTCRKVVYSPNEHSAITTNTPYYYISKWGMGPLVRHHKYGTPLYHEEEDELTYYEIQIRGDSVVNKYRVIFDTTLSISGATYSWSGDNNYICAGGNTSIGAIRGVNQTVQNGEVFVEITSPYSLTTVKGFRKGYKVQAPIDNPTVSGPTLVCSSGGQFELIDVPPNNYVTWESSNNLYTSNHTFNPCTFVSTSDGPAWIRPILNSIGCSYTLSSYTVWSGRPILYISGPQEGYVGNYYTFYANAGTYSNPTDYDDWILNPLLDNHIYDYGSYADISFEDAYEGYQVVCRAKNICSSGAWGDWDLTNISIYEDERFLLSPNPASELVTITKQQPKDVNFNQEDLNKVYTISVLDYYGNIHFSSTRSGTIFTIPVNYLKDGGYFVQINDGEKIINLKLVVKH